jgi:hypothetical protein
MRPAILSLIRKTAPGVAPKVGRQVIKLKKQSPHIFFGAGVVGVVGGTVLACRATLKLPETLSEIEHDFDIVREIKADAQDKNYPVDHGNAQRDVAYVYVKSAYKLGKLYAPALVVGSVSIAALTGSHIQLARRNTALMAAYAAVSQAYGDYRERVAEAYGTEKELDLYHASSEVKDDEAGEIQRISDPNKMSPYARFFDEYSANWNKDAELNRLFVMCQQNYANELLRARGHLFLNEVYDMLGLDRSSAGAVVGWVVGTEGDNYVDFGMYESTNSQFINGWERSILLDFNVDGVIYDKL